MRRLARYLLTKGSSMQCVLPGIEISVCALYLFSLLARKGAFSLLLISANSVVTRQTRIEPVCSCGCAPSSLAEHCQAGTVFDSDAASKAAAESRLTDGEYGYAVISIVARMQTSASQEISSSWSASEGQK
jgi:hypothetical protein